MKKKYLTLSLCVPVLLASGIVKAQEVPQPTGIISTDDVSVADETSTMNTTKSNNTSLFIPQKKVSQLIFEAVTGIKKIEKTRTIDKEEKYTEKVKKTRMVDKQVTETTTTEANSEQPELVKSGDLAIHGKVVDVQGPDYFKDFSLVSHKDLGGEILATPISIGKGQITKDTRPSNLPENVFKPIGLTEGSEVVYKNVAKTVSGKSIDMKLVVEFINPAQTKDVTPSTKFADNRDKGDLELTQDTTRGDYKFIFLDSETGQPVKILGAMTVNDIDDAQTFEFKSEKIVSWNKDQNNMKVEKNDNQVKFIATQTILNGSESMPNGAGVIGFFGSELSFKFDAPTGSAKAELFGSSQSVSARNVTTTKTIQVPEEYTEDVTKTKTIQVPEKYTEDKTVIETLRVELGKTDDTGKFDSVILKDVGGKAIDLKLTDNIGEFTPEKEGKYTIEYAVSSTGEKVVDFTVTVKTTEKAVDGVKEVAKHNTRLESQQKAEPITQELSKLEVFVTKFVDENGKEIKEKVVDTKVVDKIEIDGYEFMKSEKVEEGTKHIYRKIVPPVKSEVKTLPKTGDSVVSILGQLLGGLMTGLSGFVVFKKRK